MSGTSSTVRCLSDATDGAASFKLMFGELMGAALAAETTANASSEFAACSGKLSIAEGIASVQ